MRQYLFWLGLVALARTSLAQAPASNPYEYDISRFERVASNLLQYVEQEPVACGIAGPHAMAVDADGNVCLLGEKEGVILSREWKRLPAFALSGAASCAAFLPTGRILAGLRDHVELLDRTGRVENVWVSMGENAMLTSIAVGTQEVYLADAGSRTVWRFDHEGRLKGQIGATGEESSRRFIVPSPYFDVVLSGETLWIANPGRLRVEKHTLDGKFLEQWGKAGMGIESFCGCCNPTHIALVGDGRFATAEKGLARVKIYNADGTIESVVAGASSFTPDGPSCTKPASIRDLAVDRQGRILVLDGAKETIRVFVRK
jgi:hypothetical protein